ncbi:hypothetical protein ACVIHF_008821 [Bradyrhizobium sp. USDA 4506]
MFEIERDMNGRGADERRAVRQERSKPPLEDVYAWLLRARETLSRSSEVLKVLKPINYMLGRWDDFARFLDDGRICLTNNCAERALRGIAVGGRNWTFAGSQRGADRAAIMLTMITTCRLNDVDPKAWLADVLARIRRSSRVASARIAALGMEAPAPSRKPADQQAASPSLNAIMGHVVPTRMRQSGGLRRMRTGDADPHP